MNMIQKADIQDVPVLSAMLARAFADEEFWNWAIGASKISRVEANSRLTQVFKIQLLKFALPDGEVYCNADQTGAALWSAPHQWNMGLFQQILLLPDFMRIVGITGLWQLSRVVELIQKHHPKEPHYYLQVLGVDPIAQGQGLSRYLLHSVLEKCDVQKVPAYLETATPANIALYRHFGFELLKTMHQLPYGAPTLYCMYRVPKNQ